MAFSNLTCQLGDTRIGVFWLHCVSDNKEIKLGSGDQDAALSAGKNAGVVLVCHVAHGSVSLHLLPVR